MNERREIRVHPNSTAARKWGRTTWSTTTRSPWAIAADADRAGDVQRAAAARRAGARTTKPDLNCG